jgi:hypothetical protein
MEFPVIGDVSSFRVQGTTAEIFNEACPAAETWCHK